MSQKQLPHFKSSRREGEAPAEPRIVGAVSARREPRPPETAEVISEPFLSDVCGSQALAQTDDRREHTRRWQQAAGSLDCEESCSATGSHSSAFEEGPTLSTTRALQSLVLGITLTSLSCSPSPSESRSLLGPGQLLPQLQAEGWLNGTAPSNEALIGRVVVIDCWAFW